ncbi:MAG: hypothetical protein E7G24_02545, partial [Clostridium celatum]|nr:hypothetical protein [Clostridium celatum]
AKVDAEIECIEAVDKILTGVLIERTDMTWKETFDFNTAFGKYYAEYRFVTSKIGKEKRLKMLQELEKEVISKVESLIIEGKSRGQIVKNLMSDYKEKVGLTTPEANNVYKRTYEKYKLYIKEIETEVIKSIIGHLENNQKSEGIINLIKIEYPKISENDIRGMYIIAKEEFMKPKYEDYTNVHYVGSESDKRAAEKRKAKKEVAKKEQKPEEKVKEAIVEVGKAGAEFLKGFNKVVKEKKMSNLKVINEVVKVVSRELEGEFGKYIADENGVTREDITFKDLEAVENYKKEQLEKFEREIAELEAVFEFVKE